MTNAGAAAAASTQTMQMAISAAGPKTTEEMAADLSGKLGKNTVEFETPSTVGHIDLAGKAHFDKPTQQKIPTPHVQTRPKNVGANGKMNLGKETTRPATKADVRTAAELAKRK